MAGGAFSFRNKKTTIKRVSASFARIWGRAYLAKASITVVLAVSWVLLIPHSSFAWKPITHIFLATQVLEDALDGKITIYRVDYEKGEILKELGTYEVDPQILKLIRNNRDSFFPGNFGPDAYPDIITGGMVIHADKSPGPTTHDWLNHLWQTGFKEINSTDYVRAWVLGFLCHAAGDMYIHTFINHFAGGNFELGDNAVRHIVFESYIAKRQQGPKTYSVNFPNSVRDFIFKNLVNPTPGSRLETFFLTERAAKLSPPRLFSNLRNAIQKDIEESWFSPDNPINQYRQNWRDDVEKTLKEWVPFSHELARTLFLGEMQASPSAAKGIPFPEDPAYTQGLTVRTGPGERFFAEEEHALSNDQEKETKMDLAKDLVDNFINNYLKYSLPVPDELIRYSAQLSEYLDKLMPQFIKDFQKAVRNGFLDLACILVFGCTYEEFKEYTKHPEKYFDQVLARPPGPNIKPKVDILQLILSFIERVLFDSSAELKGLSWWSLVPDSLYERVANSKAIVITRQEANKTHLKISDTGYSTEWRWRSFPPAFNTVQLIKLMFLKKEEVNRLMDDLEKLISGDEQSTLRLSADNILLEGGFCHSIDESNSWLHGQQMLLARNPKYYVQLFMRQVGEKAVENPFRIEEPPPKGGVISRVSLAPGYLKEFTNFANFKPREFLNWFFKSSRTDPPRTMVYGFIEKWDRFWSYRPNHGVGERYAEEIKAIEEKGEIPPIIYGLAEEYRPDEQEHQLIRAGEDLAFEVEYLLWGFKKDEEVDVKVVAETDAKGTTLVPFEKKHKFGAKEPYQKGNTTFSFACQYPQEKDAARHSIRLDLKLNGEVKSSLVVPELYAVEGPGTDFDGYGNLDVKVKYQFDVPREWEDSKSSLEPKLEVALVPLTPLKEDVKAKIPKPIMDRLKEFSFQRVPLGQFRVRVEVVKEETSPDDSDRPHYTGPMTGETTVTLFNPRPVKFLSPEEVEKIDVKYLPRFSADVELGKITLEDTKPKKAKSQALQWKILALVQDEEGRPVIHANVSCVAATGKDLGDGRYLLGPIDDDFKRLHVSACTYETSIHKTVEPVMRCGSDDVLYNGNSQVNETIVIRGLRQPKWTIGGRAIYQDGSPLVLQDIDTFDIVVEGGEKMDREITGISYRLGPFALPGDSLYNDPQRDTNRRTLKAAVLRKGQSIAQAAAEVLRKGDEYTNFDIRFPLQYRSAIEPEEKKDKEAGEEKAGPEEKKDDRPPFVKNTEISVEDKSRDESRSEERAKDEKGDKDKEKSRGQVPSFVKNTKIDREKDKPPSEKAQPAPPGECVEPGRLKPPVEPAQIPAALEGMGLEILEISGDKLSYTLQIKDHGCAARYGLKEKTQWVAGPPSPRERYRAEPGVPVDKGRQTGIINGIGEAQGKIIKLHLTIQTIEVADWCAVPDWVGISGRDEGNRWFDTKYNMRKTLGLNCGK